MPKHYLSYIANAILFTTLMHDHKVNARNKAKFKEIVETNTRLREYLIKSSDQVDYLVSIITKHEIDVDEFDLIMLRNLIPDTEEE